ncbi:YbhB/YbcL family Raf kinase inhibitor-like protein [Microbacterium sp. Gd 4-13]|uniref:YbhB/YbcL family Raf kinase inhibitor-like protein n=1 Tax=Microbacterium sp. Gd 4-13 TaxID=2173179 RepID=UPI000D567A77|nr:YbhB/YbcL family Raf kinase inhibitor-like protein [Microbacterium sp. Gd 4-13]PVW02148.1 YbhB/YbcL family Raf kinase inhibitor-like protein [Microbacterium sp. Gd 4-13]
MSLPIDKLAVKSPDFDTLTRIPEEFSADGGNRVPRVVFDGVPEGTVELAVIVHDPDAPLPQGFTHWVVYGVAADSTELDVDADGVRQGPNTAGVTSYYGPQPPAGHGEHHYYFWVFALSRRVEGTPSREEFLDEYADAIIEQARTVGLFSR